MTLSILSPDFAEGAAMPVRCTCEGADQSPALVFAGVPAAAKSLALIVDDPDAPDPAHPKMTWVHWVLYGLPPGCTGLEAGVRHLPPGTHQGLNDWKRTGYGGPCPPIGRHRYFHRLFALDVVLPDLKSPTKAQLLAAMEGHGLETATLVGTYEKAKRH